MGTLPFRYLGIPVAARHLRNADYSLLIETLEAKIQSWPRHSLSYAGKIELIRAVLQGVECYWLSILPLPVNTLNMIHSICRKFVWPSKRPPIAWDTVCKPVMDGGLGLKNLKAWNKALLAKTLWKIQMKKDSLWIRWVNHIYGRNGTIWNWDWHKDNSPLMKQLVLIRDEMVNGFGSVEIAMARLNAWFGGNVGMTKAYEFFMHSRGQWPWKLLLSSSCIVPKHRFVLWLLAPEKLLTRDRLQFVEDKSCVLCHAPVESIKHLFFECMVTRRLWEGIRKWLGMHKIMGSRTSLLCAYRLCYSGTSTLAKMRKVALAATTYNI